MTTSEDSITRFSNRVENYIKYRPDYPRQIIAYLKKQNALTVASIVADIGCGPGQSAKMFLENGNSVIGVEPNEPMREAAKEILGSFPNFTIVDGASENTTLLDDSVDLVIAAQAFHWFEPEATRNEFQRILRPGGYVALMWNERQLDTTPFLVDYEAFLLKYATDYSKVRHENVDGPRLQDFFQWPYLSARFDNVQVFDLNGLKGRMFSSSYMPSEDAPVAAGMIAELEALFAKYNTGGRIDILYDTNVYLSQL